MNNNEDFLAEDFLEEQSVYQMIVYLPLGDLQIEQGMVIDRIVDQAQKNPQLLNDSEADILQGIEAVLQNSPHLGNSVINDLSWVDNNNDGKDDHPSNGMEACTFTNESQDMFITFRGTSSGAWVDNAKMMIGDLKHCRETWDKNGNTYQYMSPMQAEALEYTNSLLNKYSKDGQWNDSNQKHYVVGHSKGGNPVKFLTLIYSDYFDAGLTMDAPGFSKALYAELKEKLGEDKVQEGLNKLYGLNGSNDYVHRLGLEIILLENTRWFEEYQYGPAVLSNHFIQAYIDIENGTIAPFADGQGPVSAFVEKVMDVAMELPPDERDAVFMSLLIIMQFGYAGEPPVNVWDERLLEIYGNMDNGLALATGIILAVLTQTEEGAALIEYLKQEGIIDALNNKLDELKSTFKGLPAETQIQVASLMACLVVLILYLGIIESQKMTIAENLQFMLDSVKYVADMGAAMVRVYIQMVQAIISGLLKGISFIGQKNKELATAISTWFRGDGTPPSGKIAVHYDSVKAANDMIDSAQPKNSSTVSSIMTAISSLNTTKYWKVDIIPMLGCIDKIELWNQNLLRYAEALNDHAANQRKQETEFIANLGKTDW